MVILTSSLAASRFHETSAVYLHFAVGSDEDDNENEHNQYDCQDGPVIRIWEEKKQQQNITHPLLILH